jgi:hypothetical protein
MQISLQEAIDAGQGDIEHLNNLRSGSSAPEAMGIVAKLVGQALSNSRDGTIANADLGILG